MTPGRRGACVLAGRLDAAGTEKIEIVFAAQVRAAPGHVLVDMTGVGFVGSLGIRMLISAARVADRAGRKVVHLRRAARGARSVPHRCPG